MYRNKQVFSTVSAALLYRRSEGLRPAEVAALRNARTDGATLDLGMGAGRTTAALAPLARRYVGIDYAAPMVAACEARFAGMAGVSFVVADAGALPLEAGAFDLVLFSYNGIDYVDHAHRLRILREVRRVLAPGGRFVFSTHQRGSAGLQRRPRFRPPVRARGVARTLVEWVNWARLRGAEQECAEYALVNDAAHLFGLVTYCIGRGAQVRQLEGTGFRVLAVLGPDGEAAETASDAPELHYVAEAA